MYFKNIPKWPVWYIERGGWDKKQMFNAKLSRIDDLIKKYHHVEDMSRLNILMELKDAIMDWADDDYDPERLEAMQALEEVVLRKLCELDRWGRHRYLKVVCLGYQIKTGEYDENKLPSSIQERDLNEEIELGKRIASLQSAITSAHTKYHDINKALALDEDRKILKIFMAPEFYFRGPYGAYRTLDSYTKILDKMRGHIGTDLYDDWLFVHGTAIVETEETDNPKSPGVEPGNFAMVQKGGRRTSELKDFYVQKEFPSHIDFKHPGLDDVHWYNRDMASARIAGKDVHALGPDGGRKDPVSKPLGVKDKQVSEMVGGTIFTMDGITFGLEVCRDHFLGRLAHGSGGRKVMVQLIPSCGMDITLASIACVDQGIVFNVDGVEPHVHLQINDPGKISKAELAGWTPSGGGNILITKPIDLPLPVPVRAEVAQRLKISERVLSGTVPPPPRKPAPRRLPNVVAPKK
jgi:hypothetical protein